MYAQPLLHFRRTRPLVGLIAAIALLTSLVGQRWLAATPTVVTPALAEQLLQLPLQFIPNVGQAPAAVHMLTHALGGSLEFAPTGVALALPGDSAEQPIPVRLAWAGANPNAMITGADQLPSVHHSYVGDPSQWRTNVATYAAVDYTNLYPGIDLRYDGVEGTLKGTYTVAPHADPSLIRWHYEGANNVAVDATTGHLNIVLPNGQALTEHAPIAWQDVDGQRVPVSVRYGLDHTTQHSKLKAQSSKLGFVLGSYNPALPLVIDPTLTYSTYLGGSSVDRAHGVAADAEGNAYIVGRTMSSNFPQASNTNKGANDVFVAKLSTNGRTLLWSTYLGGSSSDQGSAIAVDKDGNAWITGNTDSTNYPTTPNAVSKTFKGGSSDTIVSKLTANGQLDYSTYYGYPQFDGGADIAVDTSGNAYMTNTLRTQAQGDNIAVVKFAPTGQEIFGITFGGGRSEEPTSLAVDAAGNVYLAGTTGDSGFANDFPVTANALQAQCGGTPGNCGEDAFLAVLKADASDLLYATYLGGTVSDEATGIALDPQGNIYLSGLTSSANFPTVNAHQPTCPSGLSTSLNGYCNFYDGFVAKINAASVTGGTSNLVYSSFVGGPGSDDMDFVEEIVADAAGNAYLLGHTSSQTFFTKDAVQANSGGGLCPGFFDRFCFDAFITKYGPEGGEPLWSTYLGGNGDEYAQAIALDSEDNVLVTGYTESRNYPVTEGAFQTTRSASDEGFIAKIGQRAAPPPTETSTTTGDTPTNTPTTAGDTPTNTPTTQPTMATTGIPTPATNTPTGTVRPTDTATTGSTAVPGQGFKVYLPLIRR